MSARAGALGRPLPPLTGRTSVGASPAAAGIRTSASRVKNELSDLLAATRVAAVEPPARRTLPPRAASYASMPRTSGWLPRRESAARMRRAAAARAAAAANASLRKAVREGGYGRRGTIGSEVGMQPKGREMEEEEEVVEVMGAARRQFSEVTEEVVAL